MLLSGWILAAIGWGLLALNPLALVRGRQKDHLSGWLPAHLTTFLLALAWTALTVPIVPLNEETGSAPLLLMAGYQPDDQEAAYLLLAIAVFQVALAMVALIAASAVQLAVRQLDLRRNDDPNVS